MTLYNYTCTILDTCTIILSLVGSSTDMTAVCAMDESIHGVGRPFGGCAIVWRASINSQIAKIDSECNRLCAIIYTCNNTSVLLLNCYMPCDNRSQNILIF